MFISLSKARRVDRSSCLMFAGRDDRTANAEHQRQQWRHIYIVYGPPHGRYARFALAMFRASAAEVRAIIISSDNFGVFGSVTFASQALPHLLIGEFLHFTWVGTGLWGTISPLGAFAEGVGNILNNSLQFYYQLLEWLYCVQCNKFISLWSV